MSGFDLEFEDALRRVGLEYVIPGSMTATILGYDPVAPEVPIFETPMPSKSKKGQSYGTRRSPTEKTPKPFSIVAEWLKRPMAEVLETIVEGQQDVVKVDPFSQLSSYVLLRKTLV